ncbi:MAG: metal-dependent transcriptional regulator [Bryobacterales bacterium]|jgi:DtxR family Mn-dependent transcriptional regulator|nr:metal-dependent transcriptional regulator [Bryobacterales bacterium]
MPKAFAQSTESVDDYLKAIYEISGGQGKAGTSEIARRLRVAAASVTGMLRKLSTLSPPLVRYEKNRGVSLTLVGQRRAVEIIRHHRLLECFLHHALGYEWHEVHAEAERLEHFISEDFEARIAAQLGDPLYDPHGHPIPRKDGSVPRCIDTPLPGVNAGVAVRISRVSDEDPAALRLLASHGVRPNVVLHVVDKPSRRSGVVLRHASQQPFRVSAAVAARIAVEVLNPPQTATHRARKGMAQ